MNSAGIYFGTVRETKGTSVINSVGIYCGTVRETKGTSIKKQFWYLLWDCERDKRNINQKTVLGFIVVL